MKAHLSAVVLIALLNGSSAHGQPNVPPNELPGRERERFFERPDPSTVLPSADPLVRMPPQVGTKRKPVSSEKCKGSKPDGRGGCTRIRQ